MATIYLDSNPQLQALAALAFPDYHGRKFEVNSAESIRCPSYWDGGTRSYFAVVKGSTIEHIGECGGLNQPSVPMIALDANTVVLEHRISCGKDMGITFHIHPSRLPQFLPSPKSDNPLTWSQCVVLTATRSLKSSYGGIPNYRYHEAHSDTGITLAEYESAKAELSAMGLLDKRGAITPAGRNAIGMTDLWTLKRERPEVVNG